MNASTSTVTPLPTTVLKDPQVLVYMEDLHKLGNELEELFPEREPLIKQLIYAILTRQHVLTFGETGTAKSLLVEFLFQVFTDSTLYSIQLDKFTKPASLVGIPSTRVLREEDRIWYNPENTVLRAQFIELDELFDASDFLLRSLLGLLNERRYRFGNQTEEALLHTAFASTNMDPDTEIKRSDMLRAVVDRFLFTNRVDYLKDSENRRRMYRNALRGEKPSIHIPYQSMQTIANALDEVDFLSNPELIDVYERVVEAYDDDSTTKISDRRKVQTMSVIQAHALLFGRTHVILEDIMAAMWSLVEGTDQEQRDNFKKVAEPIIDEAISNNRPDIVATQLDLLETYEARIPKIRSDVEDNPYTPDELVTMKRAVQDLLEDFNEFKPSATSVEDKQRDLRKLVVTVDGTIDHLIKGGSQR